MNLQEVHEHVDRSGFDKDYLSSSYLDWVKTPFYIILQRFNESLGDMEYSWFRTAKRGDSVYSRRVRSRFGAVVRSIPDVKFFGYGCRGSVKSSALEITLTYDRSVDIAVAWRSVGVDLNRFLSGLRRRFGSLSIARGFEAHGDWYPHVHLIVYFHNFVFDGFSHVDAKRKLVYLVRERDDIKRYWSQGFIKVYAMSSLRSGFGYFGKYFLKAFDSDLVKQGSVRSKSVKTLSCCWFFRKRSFGLSGSWRSSYDSIRRSYANSNKFIPYVVAEDGSVVFLKRSVVGFYKGDHVLLAGWYGLLESSDLRRLGLDSRSCSCD